jgi:hypothetical protein
VSIFGRKTNRQNEYEHDTRKKINKINVVELFVGGGGFFNLAFEILSVENDKIKQILTKGNNYGMEHHAICCPSKYCNHRNALFGSLQKVRASLASYVNLHHIP